LYHCWVYMSTGQGGTILTSFKSVGHLYKVTKKSNGTFQYAIEVDFIVHKYAH
jgi:hypothetical protein